MELINTREFLNVRDADLTDSRFSDVKLEGAEFDDVNLRRSGFTHANLVDARFLDVNLENASIRDVNLTGSSFLNVNLTRATIQDANLTGMSINGILVTDLFDAFRNRARTVLYAKDLAVMQGFYQGALKLNLEHSQPDHVVLGSSTSQLVIVQVPASVASTIHVAKPPVRRAQATVKMVFEVESLSAVRDMVPELGGGIDPAQSEWSYQGHRVCDGHDPEGNVVQFQQRHHQSDPRADLKE